MIEVLEMSGDEIDELLSRVGYGHLACSLNDRPYVVPVNYVYEKPEIFIYTTEGMKSEIIKANPRVCLQVEEVIGNDDWRSVVINAEAKATTAPKEREKILKLIVAKNPTLTPAISIRWLDNWIRENREVLYRLTPSDITGRGSLKVKIAAAFARPSGA